MGSVRITGDIHADLKRFNSKNFPEGKDLTKDDYVIILGDFGIVWQYEKNKEEDYWLDWLEEKPWTTLFIDGNHENFARLNSEFKKVDFCGGQAHQLRPSVLHLMRGNVFEICEYKFFTFGGARSTDVTGGILDPKEYCNWNDFIKVFNYYDRNSELPFRVKGYSWWPQEMASDEEKDRGRYKLFANNWRVDYVLTHCAPTSISSLIGAGLYQPDDMTNYLEELKQNLAACTWFYGHYHDERIDHEGALKFVCKYENIERII